MSARERRGLAPALPSNYARVCSLLLIAEAPAHGYELLQRLRASGDTDVAGGAFYRNLRAMEDDGLIQSRWRDGGAGAPRRVYSMTEKGVERLHANAERLLETLAQVDTYLARYDRLGGRRARRTAAA